MSRLRTLVDVVGSSESEEMMMVGSRVIVGM